MSERDEKKFYNPQDVAVLLSDIIRKKARYEYNKKKQRQEKIDWWYYSSDNIAKNISLLFDKFIPEPIDEKEKNENKQKYLEFIIKEFNEFITSKTDIQESILNRQETSIKSLSRENYRIDDFLATLQWRMVIGLGSDHPQETSMTLHHIYGIPYIPGSALKGVTRHYRIWKIFEEIFNEPSEKDLEQVSCLEKILENTDLTNKDESKRDDRLDKKEFEEKFKVKKKNDNQTIEIRPSKELSDLLKREPAKIVEFKKIFGTQKNKGEVIFFDAYPVEKINLKLDVMTPHYGPYYSEGEPPADYHNPNPVKFLTVEKTKFRFYLASREGELLNTAKVWLSETLKENGIGAKTALGYGVFLG